MPSEQAVYRHNVQHLCTISCMCFRFSKCAHQLLGERAGQTPLCAQRYIKHVLALTQTLLITLWEHTVTPALNNQYLIKHLDRNRWRTDTNCTKACTSCTLHGRQTWAEERTNQVLSCLQIWDLTVTDSLKTSDRQPLQPTERWRETSKDREEHFKQVQNHSSKSNPPVFVWSLTHN